MILFRLENFRSICLPRNVSVPIALFGPLVKTILFVDFSFLVFDTAALSLCKYQSVVN